MKAKTEPFVPFGLSVEYREGAEIVVGVEKPRFGWKIASSERGFEQSGYQVVVESARGVLWDSGKVESDAQSGVVYAGAALASSEAVHWRVRVWNGAGEASAWSEEAHFLVGLLEGWKATWIGARAKVNQPAFAKRFRVGTGLVRAVLHVTGVGYYEAQLNGRKVGTKVLDPSPTAYDKTVLYSSYEVGAQLSEGENELKVLLGHGLYEVLIEDTWDFQKAPWRNSPRMIAQLELEYADGKRERVVSDGSWRQVESAVSFDAFREGEIVGGRHPKAVDLEAECVLAEEVPGPGGILKGAPQPGAKVVRELVPTGIYAVEEGGWMVEFGENVAGWIRLKVRGLSAGDVVSMRYDERVGEGHQPVKKRSIDSFYHASASAEICAQEVGFQTNRFVSAGAAEEVVEPRFTYNGFQYVWIRGLKEAPRLEDVVGCVVRTDFARIGSFECSDGVLNTLMEMGRRSYESNFADGVPTDCPHREKNGWTGDASIASELAQYLFENTAAYEKWLGDIVDAQNEQGDLPGIVPTSGWGFSWGNGPAWDSALPVIAWNLYVYRGDVRALELVKPALQRYLAYTATKADAQGLVKHGLGDWIPVNKDHAPTEAFTSSCYYFQAQRIYEEICKVLGEDEEAARIAATAAQTRAGLREAFLQADGTVANGGQTAQAMALTFGLVDEGERAAVAARLVASVERAGEHVDVGLLGTKHLFRALSLVGRTDLAYRVLTQPTAPSMVEWLQKGYTTLWEDWGDGYSRNHIMFGDFVAWAYQFLAGIRVAESAGSTAAVPLPKACGLREVAIAPQIIPELEYVAASVDGPMGTIASEWRRDLEGHVRVNVTVPPNVTASVQLPGRDPERVGSGAWEWIV